jgi:hypothetical protein
MSYLRRGGTHQTVSADEITRLDKLKAKLRQQVRARVSKPDEVVSARRETIAVVLVETDTHAGITPAEVHFDIDVP